jgi:cytochrome P450
MKTTLALNPTPDNPPQAPGRLPYFGHLVAFGRDPLGFIDKTVALGDVVEVKIPGYRAFQLYRAEDVEQVLIHINDKDFAKFDIPIATVPLALGEGLFTAKGDLWARQRRMMQPAFHRQRIEAYGVIMVERTQQMLDRWQANSVIDIGAEMMALTLEIVCDARFGVDTSQRIPILGEALHVLVEDFAQRSANPLQLSPPIPTPRNRRLQRAVKTLETQLFEIVAERPAKGNLEEGNDLLAMLLLAHDDEHGAMSDKQLRDELITLFIAGHETTALALTWAFYLLSQHPASDAAIAAEIRQALEDRQPTLADLPNLKAADRVARESMRLYPPLWSIASRLVLQDCELSGYQIPKGSVIFLSPWAMHRNPRYFANPLDFQPERWTDEFIKTLPRYAYFPFGAGQRVCIGLPFAMLEATLALAMTVRRFKLELVAGQQVDLLPSFTLRPKEKMMMRVVER